MDKYLDKKDHTVIKIVLSYTVILLSHQQK